MKRRLDLAAALVHDPEVLFLDEPTTGLDPVSRARVWEEVRRLNAELGMTIFLTTQYLEEADALADRVGIIDNGPHRRRGHARPSSRRRVGTDLVDRPGRRGRRHGGRERARAASTGVDRVEVHGHEVTVAAAARGRG